MSSHYACLCAILWVIVDIVDSVAYSSDRKNTYMNGSP